MEFNKCNLNLFVKELKLRSFISFRTLAQTCAQIKLINFCIDYVHFSL